MKTKGFTLIELMIVVAIIAIIAAIAVPNLLQSRMQANETNAIGGLRTYASGQSTWKKARYQTGAGLVGAYAGADTAGNPITNAGRQSLSELAYGLDMAAGGGDDRNLVPTAFANACDAIGAPVPYQGYYFGDDIVNITDWGNDFGMYAMAASQNRSGVNAFWIDGSGEVRGKDSGPAGLGVADGVQVVIGNCTAEDPRVAANAWWNP